MCLTAKHFGLQEENINIRERPLIMKTGWGTQKEKERKRERERKREGGCTVFLKRRIKAC